MGHRKITLKTQPAPRACFALKAAARLLPTPERQFLPQRYVAILAKNFMFICTGVVFWKSQRPVWHLHRFAGIWHPAPESRRMLYNKRNSVLLLRIASTTLILNESIIHKFTDTCIRSACFRMSHNWPQRRKQNGEAKYIFLTSSL